MDAGRVRIGFGRHRAKTISEIDQEDRGYVGWLAKNATDADIRQAARQWRGEV
jgi:hypothetical protein